MSNANPKSKPHPEPQAQFNGQVSGRSHVEAPEGLGFTEEQLYDDQPFGPIIYQYTRKQAIEDGVC